MLNQGGIWHKWDDTVIKTGVAFIDASLRKPPQSSGTAALDFTDINNSMYVSLIMRRRG